MITLISLKPSAFKIALKARNFRITLEASDNTYDGFAVNHVKTNKNNFCIYFI